MGKQRNVKKKKTIKNEQEKKRTDLRPNMVAFILSLIDFNILIKIKNWQSGWKTLNAKYKALLSSIWAGYRQMDGWRINQGKARMATQKPR